MISLRILIEVETNVGGLPMGNHPMSMTAEKVHVLEETLNALAGLDPSSAGRVRIRGELAAVTAQMVEALCRRIELDRSRLLITHTGDPDHPLRVCTFCTLKKENAGTDFSELPAAAFVAYKDDGDACFTCEACAEPNRKTHPQLEPIVDFFKRVKGDTVTEALEKPA